MFFTNTMLFGITRRISFALSDAGGIVYHSRYLDFYEEVRLEFLLSLGITQRQLKLKYDIMLVVRRCQLEYKKPARIEELLAISLESLKLKGPLILAEHRTCDEGKNILQEGVLQLVAIDGAFRPMRRLPSELVKKLLEAGAQLY
jgi:acyl-CoA thioester hydrolase